MATAAASYFSGTNLMPSQRVCIGASAPSPSKPRDPRFSGCVPATVRHIARSFAAAAAADGGGDPVLSIDGVETSNVRVFGRVVSMVSKNTDVSFTLDDGTGKIALVRWITDQPDVREAAYIKEGVYVKVHANLTGFPPKKQGFARFIRPVTNFNEVVLHFIECIHVHMENARPKVQGQYPPAVQTNGYTHVPYSGGVRDRQVHFTPQVNQEQFHPAVQTNTSTYVPFSGGVREHQYHFSQANQGHFPPAAHTNTPTHVPFFGGVREHQAHFTPQVNQFSAYSGTGGQQHDLQKMVLDVMHQPEILALENGVHIDEVARRTGTPKTTILEVLKFLADMGFLCWTVDDNHVKVVYNS